MQLDATKRKVNIYYNNEKSPKTIESYVGDIRLKEGMSYGDNKSGKWFCYY